MNRLTLHITMMAVALASVGCGADDEEGDSRFGDSASTSATLTATASATDTAATLGESGSDDDGEETGPKLDVGGDDGTPEVCENVLPITVRDFRAFGEPGGHTDFEISDRGVYENGQLYQGWNDVGCGLVEPNLGGDRKPVFYAGPADVNEGGPQIKSGVGRQQRVVSGPGCWPSENGVCNVGTCQPWTFDPPTYEIESANSFNQWYNTVDGVNMEFDLELEVVETAPDSGIYVYDSSAFFPIDNMGFGNSPGQSHNFHFTTEVHVLFEYEAGQVFSFRGDDDLWIFVNGKLALDVGGLHEDLEGSINFDAQAAELGIVPGEYYEMDIFHAERQSDESNFRVETNIRCFTPNPVE